MLIRKRGNINAIIIYIYIFFFLFKSKIFIHERRRLVLREIKFKRQKKLPPVWIFLKGENFITPSFTLYFASGLLLAFALVLSNRWTA